MVLHCPASILGLVISFGICLFWKNLKHWHVTWSLPTLCCALPCLMLNCVLWHFTTGLDVAVVLEGAVLSFFCVMARDEEGNTVCPLYPHLLCWVCGFLWRVGLWRFSTSALISPVSLDFASGRAALLSSEKHKAQLEGPIFFAFLLTEVSRANMCKEHYHQAKKKKKKVEMEMTVCTAVDVHHFSL